MKERASRNRTLNCAAEEKKSLGQEIRKINCPQSKEEILNKIICGDFFAIADYLPENCVDLLILDPPYNLCKNYNGFVFKETTDYQEWFENIVTRLRPTLKATSSLYVCSDWKTSVLIAPILQKHFCVRNRITWERDKGRGAKSNWKNNTEDIWFCTRSDDYYFNVDAVKMKRKVLAPYKVNGAPKDWREEEDGKFRITHPSNSWTDITIPFWSMAENTDHPTQKPEKLIAKLVLASSKENDFIFDPFMGSGTTAVVARKLKRNFCGIELNHDYCCWAIKRLQLASENKQIQGYTDGVFWERNSMDEQNKTSSTSLSQGDLFS